MANFAAIARETGVGRQAPGKITEAVPSPSIAGSGITGASPQVCAYDARDNLLLVPDDLGKVNAIDPDTVQIKGLVTLSARVGFVVFGNSGYALGLGSLAGAHDSHLGAQAFNLCA